MYGDIVPYEIDVSVRTTNGRAERPPENRMPSPLTDGGGGMKIILKLSKSYVNQLGKVKFQKNVPRTQTSNSIDS